MGDVFHHSVRHRSSSLAAEGISPNPSVPGGACGSTEHRKGDAPSDTTPWVLFTDVLPFLGVAELSVCHWQKPWERIAENDRLR